MTTITVYGASDDLIVVGGELVEEFYLKNRDEGDLLAFSDGTVLRVAFTPAGTWRITPVTKGEAGLEINVAPEDSHQNYTDRVTLRGDVRWVVHGVGWAQAAGGVR